MRVTDSTYFSPKHWFEVMRLTNRQSFHYEQFRRNVLKRDKYRCVHCGSKNYLNVHHIKRYSENLTERLKTKNGITLCMECHKTRHSWMHEREHILRKKDACITSLLTSEADRPLPEGVTDKGPAL